MWTTKDLQCKEIYLPGRQTDWDLAINLAILAGGHNGNDVSLNSGRIAAYEGLDTGVPAFKYDLRKQAGSTN